MYQSRPQHNNGARRPMPAPRHSALPPLKKPHEMSHRGKIKFYDPRRGYGFITQEGGPDVFLHGKVVFQYGLTDRQLEPDTPVRFTPADEGRNRLAATCVALG